MSEKNIMENSKLWLGGMEQAFRICKTDKHPEIIKQNKSDLLNKFEKLFSYDERFNVYNFRISKKEWEELKAELEGKE